MLCSSPAAADLESGAGEARPPRGPRVNAAIKQLTMRPSLRTFTLKPTPVPLGSTAGEPMRVWPRSPALGPEFRVHRSLAGYPRRCRILTLGTLPPVPDKRICRAGDMARNTQP